MAFEYRFNAITFYPKNEPLRFAPPETSEPFRFKNSSGWFCGLYLPCSIVRVYGPVRTHVCRVIPRPIVCIRQPILIATCQ